MDNKNLSIEQENDVFNIEKVFLRQLYDINNKDVFGVLFSYLENVFKIDSSVVINFRANTYSFKGYNVKNDNIENHIKAFKRIFLNQKALIIKKRIFIFNSTAFIPLSYGSNSYLFSFFSREHNFFTVKKIYILTRICSHLLVYLKKEEKKVFKIKNNLSHAFNKTFLSLMARSSFENIFDDFMTNVCNETKIFNSINCYKMNKNFEDARLVFSKSLFPYLVLKGIKIKKELFIPYQDTSKIITNNDFLENFFVDNKNKQVILKNIILNEFTSYIVVFELNGSVTNAIYQDFMKNLSSYVNLLITILESQKQCIELEKQQTISCFSSGVLHYFNNFLQTINARLELTAMFAKSDDKIMENLSKIKESLNYSSKFLEKFLPFINNKKEKLSNISFTDFIYSIYLEFQEQFGDCLDLEISNLEKHFIVRADEPTLHFAIWQILLNALEFSKRDLVDIKIKLEYFLNKNLKSGNFLRLSIDDIGIGMSSKVLKYAFEPFFSTKDIDKKTGISVSLNGLGLPLTRSIITSLGGFINIISDKECGTKVKIILPIDYE